MNITRHVLSASLSLFLATSSVAFSAPAAPGAAETKKARELFNAAQALYQQKRFAEAIDKFEAAYEAKPHPVIHYNIGRCYEELGKIGPAIKSYKAYLRLAPEAKDRNQVADVVASLERKLREQNLQQLTVVVEPAEAVVEVDGKVVGPSPATVEVTIGGSHRVVASLEGYEPFERTVSMTPGQATEVNATLIKRVVRSDAPTADGSRVGGTGSEGGAVAGTTTKKPDEPTPKAHPRVWTWVTGGVAVASLGTGLGLYFGARQEAAIYVGGYNGGPWPTQAEGQKHFDAANNLLVGSFVMYGVAAAAAITAVVLYFLEK